MTGNDSRLLLAADKGMREKGDGGLRRCVSEVLGRAVSPLGMRSGEEGGKKKVFADTCQATSKPMSQSPKLWFGHNRGGANAAKRGPGVSLQCRVYFPPPFPFTWASTGEEYFSSMIARRLCETTGIFGVTLSYSTSCFPKYWTAVVRKVSQE